MLLIVRFSCLSVNNYLIYYIILIIYNFLNKNLFQKMCWMLIHIRSSIFRITLSLPWSQIIVRFSLTSVVFFIRRKDKLLGPFIFPTQTRDNVLTYWHFRKSITWSRHFTPMTNRSNSKETAYKIYKYTIFYCRDLYIIAETITHLHLSILN